MFMKGEATTSDPDWGLGLSDLYVDGGLPLITRTKKERHRHPVLLRLLMRPKQGRKGFIFYIR